jgi:hypothetical protein
MIKVHSFYTLLSSPSLRWKIVQCELEISVMLFKICETIDVWQELA